MRKTIIGLSFGMLLGGCVTAPPVFNRAGATQAEFDREKRECEYDAIKNASGYDPTMRTGIGQALEQRARQQEIFVACMRSKSWQTQ
jgi:hypothetical protein